MAAYLTFKTNSPKFSRHFLTISHFTMIYKNPNLQTPYAEENTNPIQNTKKMKNQTVENILLSLISYLREVQDLIEAAQTKHAEGFTMDDNSYNIIPTQQEHPDYKILKTILEDARAENLSIEGNVAFMFGSIHKWIGKFECVMKTMPNE
ncbi:hypothetical protein Lser_V15G40536 [Lactuca serriola]